VASGRAAALKRRQRSARAPLGQAAARAGAGAGAASLAALGLGRLGRRSGRAAVEQGRRSGRDCANGEEMSTCVCGLALKRLIPVG
jgi:hypothetical protein